jgi:DNA-binding transcriptional ArsR family regulator
MTYDKAFAALADPSRRRLVEHLRSGPMPVGVLARRMPVSRPAVSQHLKVLKDAGLVAVYFIDPHGLAPLRAWLDQFWDEALCEFQAAAEQTYPTTGRTSE